ncbi:hypothetical protein ABW21_db0203173 [Orbilia brochopaga]|nr:hypothetical protein ABW21_db0203173 [Drechslerella brochopaga]
MMRPITSSTATIHTCLHITGRLSLGECRSWADDVIINIPFSPDHGLNRSDLSHCLAENLIHHGAIGLYNPVTRELVDWRSIKGHEFSRIEDAEVVWMLVYEKLALFDTSLWAFTEMLLHFRGVQGPPLLYIDELQQGIFLPTWTARVQYFWKRQGKRLACLGRKLASPKQWHLPKKPVDVVSVHPRGVVLISNPSYQVRKNLKPIFKTDIGGSHSSNNGTRTHSDGDETSTFKDNIGSSIGTSLRRTSTSMTI